jgi:hypothetical protein
MLNYNIKTENSKKYQFGNQLNYGSFLFYLLDLKTVAGSTNRNSGWSIAEINNGEKVT